MTNTTRESHTAGEWTEAADGLCAEVEKRIEATARKAAESLYEGLLYDTQDYLRENTRMNLKGEIESARASETRARQALNSIAEAVGSGIQNYYADTAARAIVCINRYKAKAKLVPTLLEAAEAYAAWMDRENNGRPDYGNLTRDTHPDGEAIWRKWYNETLDMCQRAQDLNRQAISAATGQASTQDAEA